ncbi:MAG: hypothetical protein U0942_05640 [Parvibaculum sp.]|uniref:hypothetical protein n=1 Tax=Parvibaculum sp. TaxID=2024848 RepID=UPI002AB89D34|nr:hypothetical protein [Parvibaculum sp.]MDZ4380802.1 hypothetical protein [Parvibaculum sp.]
MWLFLIFLILVLGVMGANQARKTQAFVDGLRQAAAINYERTQREAPGTRYAALGPNEFQAAYVSVVVRRYNGLRRKVAGMVFLASFLIFAYYGYSNGNLFARNFDTQLVYMGIFFVTALVVSFIALVFVSSILRNRPFPRWPEN